MKSNKRKESAKNPGGDGSGFALDEQGCLSLQRVLSAFNAPISEEHAWALFYQGASTLRRGLPTGKCRAPESPEDFLIHRDGSVYLRPAFSSTRDDVKMEQIDVREHSMVMNLAMVVYHALDYAQPEDEERLVSAELESLIRDMSAEDDIGDSRIKGCAGADADERSVGESVAGSAAETDDEGIERDSGDVLDYLPRHYCSLSDVIERCQWHSGRSGAASHYQAVCRALVAEALELSHFLARVKDGGAKDLYRRADANASSRELESLRFSDWARFWMQVIGELRMGVKLKKVDFSRTPIEYELTPYEILMDDIRSRRFKLRKVDGNIPPRVKKDAHALILEFIRSRPPLKKASERKLPPAAARTATPREQLLDSIKIGRPLKPTLIRPRTKLTAPSPARRRPREEEPEPSTARPTARRLIKVDFEPLDDDDDDDIVGVVGSPERSAPQPFPRSFTKGTPIIANGSTPKPWKRTAYDLATQCPSRRASMRRHTIVACSNPTDSLNTSGSQSVPQSRPDSRQSGISAASSEMEGGVLGTMTGTLGGTPNDISWSRNSLQDELIQSVSAPSKKQWQDAMSLDERLSLTLEEIVHIRSVLTKAELEALPVEGRVKEDVEKRKVCFLCLKTRFGLFGPWGQRCKLCKKSVCTKCYSKMRIPTEHFSNVPVVLLSPSLMPSPEDEMNDSFPRSLMARLISPEQHHDRSDNSVGSAPSSPSMQRSNPSSSMARSLEGTLNTSPAAQLPHSYVQSAPGSRGGSSMGYVPEPAHPLPPTGSIMTRSMEGPQSLPVTSGSPHHTLDRRNRFYRGATLAGGVRASDRLRGVQMIVCHDCKAMVLQIIKSSRTSRSATRNHTIRNLTLNLSPVYH